MKRNFTAFRGPAQAPEQRQKSENMPTNPLSLPGEWKKDTPTTEVANPVEDQDGPDVPRSVAGTVSEAGDIVDREGKSIGKIADSRNPQQLVGNTVTAAGDVVDSAGSVLGKADIGGITNDAENEYTTDARSNGGWLGKTTKGVFNTVGNGLGSLSGGLGRKSQDNVQDVTDSATEKAGDVPEGAEVPESETPLTEAVPKEAAEDVQSKACDAQDAATDKAGDVTNDAPDLTESGEVKLEDRDDTTDINADKPGEAVEKTGEEAQDPQEAAQAEGEEAKDTLQGDAEETKDTLQGKAEENKDTLQGEAEETKDAAEDEAEQAIDYSVLDGTTVNKVGNLVNESGKVIGRLVEGEPKQLQGKKCDSNGDIWNDAGKKVGRGEPLPDSERDAAKDYAPFENFPDAVVEADGRITSEGKQVGTVVEGDPKRLKGSKVDEDGDILDRNGNAVGKAEPWDEPEEVAEEVPDRSILAGKRVNKAGNVVDQNGAIFGRVVEGNVASMKGRMCDKDGNIRSESGDILGRAEVVPEGEREGSKEGPFAELDGLTVAKDGTVVTPSGDVVGRLVSGDGKKLFGRRVDEDGDVVDSNGNVLAKAERWEEPEVEKKRGPMAGRKVNREGNVLDEDGNIIGKLTSGDLQICAGKEVDDDGDVVNSKGNTVGHCSLLEDIPPPVEESPEEKQKREQAEKDKELAGKLAGAIEQSLDRLRPILKMITDKIDRAERTPKEELDEEQLVKQVKPLIEEGGKILTETNGIIRGMDPDGRIQRNAKHKSSTKEASPEEHHLAEVLKELTGSVTETIDNAKRKIEDMPHAKKELNPLWGLLMEPLGQILAAVGLLLTGVLGLVGRLLSGLGLGGIVDGLLGGLGLNKILGSLGLGSAYDALVGKDKKNKK